jgi:hypothetical protein
MVREISTCCIMSSSQQIPGPTHATHAWAPVSTWPTRACKYIKQACTHLSLFMRKCDSVALHTGTCPSCRLSSSTARRASAQAGARASPTTTRSTSWPTAASCWRARSPRRWRRGTVASGATSTRWPPLAMPPARATPCTASSSRCAHGTDTLRGIGDWPMLHRFRIRCGGVGWCSVVADVGTVSMCFSDA